MTTLQYGMYFFSLGHVPNKYCQVQNSGTILAINIIDWAQGKPFKLRGGQSCFKMMKHSKAKCAFSFLNISLNNGTPMCRQNTNLQGQNVFGFIFKHLFKANGPIYCTLKTHTMQGPMHESHTVFNKRFLFLKQVLHHPALEK